MIPTKTINPIFHFHLFNQRIEEDSDSCPKRKYSNNINGRVITVCLTLNPKMKAIEMMNKTKTLNPIFIGRSLGKMFLQRLLSGSLYKQPTPSGWGVVKKVSP